MTQNKRQHPGFNSVCSLQGILIQTASAIKQSKKRPIFKMYQILLAGMLLFTGILSAQTDFRPGYLIHNSGDTIYGEIDYRGDIIMSSLCKFRDKSKTIYDYSPGDIMAYRFTDHKFFVSREVDQKMVFLEFLIHGEVNIYYMRDETGDHYFLDKKGEKLTEIEYNEELKQVGNRTVRYKSTKHIGLLSYYMQDADGFETRIQKVKKPEHYNLIKLAKDYHDEVCEGEQCIIYGKQHPWIKVNPELLSGVINFSKASDLSREFQWNNGIIANIWLPRVNEKIYFKTGLLHARYTQYGMKKNFYKIPIHFGYMAPKTFRIRPNFSIGLLSPSYSAGLSFNINSRINIGIQSWLDFTSKDVRWVPSSLYSYAVMGSLYYEL